MGGVTKRRDKLINRLQTQLEMATALVNGESYTCYKEKWQKNEDTGQQEKVKVAKKVSPWFYAKGGNYYLEVRYANKPLELSKGNHAIEVGDKENLPLVVQTVIDATANGELDKTLGSLSSELWQAKKLLVTDEN
ncbi:DUF6641 family protein [Pseudoalteromonas sp. JC3]|uniref:DUF6641 family protein n=1 Tax=Pseudoalteromonas sp. JC3 TaxID=2810196 RepID=UPI0019D082AD|nr:DUF6641 family protein [Pseudoalteromonas sp. JC3]MBR8845479.1 hypothetical protein [Pseudoalteromonas sp. JC3]WJE09246.1 hypothetical protein QSH61_01905 [Pseudoalteromonas sp. JC3]